MTVPTGVGTRSSARSLTRCCSRSVSCARTLDHGRSRSAPASKPIWNASWRRFETLRFAKASDADVNQAAPGDP